MLVEPFRPPVAEEARERLAIWRLIDRLAFGSDSARGQRGDRYLDRSEAEFSLERREAA